jgi:hypothetical protein
MFSARPIVAAPGGWPQVIAVDCAAIFFLDWGTFRPQFFKAMATFFRFRMEGH